MADPEVAGMAAEDKDGQVVEVGDLVDVRARVASVAVDDRYGNVSLETVEIMPPTGNTTALTLNSRQVTLVDKRAPQAAAPAGATE